MAERKRLGVAVVGSGRIGTIRTRQVLEHPAGDFVAVSDAKAENAVRLAANAGAHFHSASNREIIEHPDVSTVIPGMRKLRHVDANIAASDAGPLPAELLTQLRRHRWVRQPTEWSQ